LLEALIAMVLGTVVLTAVLSAFLMIGRTSFNSSSYSQLDAEMRRALEIFGQDARNASGIQWHSGQSLTFTLPSASNPSTQTSYAYDDQIGSETRGCFYSVAGADPTAAPRRVLARNVDPTFAFQRFKLDHTTGPGAEATNDAETKQIQLSLRLSIRGATTVAATQASISACYVLRNKQVAF
jgi:Tfp pilus assembly protein PilW